MPIMDTSKCGNSKENFSIAMALHHQRPSLPLYFQPVATGKDRNKLLFQPYMKDFMKIVNF